LSSRRRHQLGDGSSAAAPACQPMPRRRRWLRSRAALALGSGWSPEARDSDRGGRLPSRPPTQVGEGGGSRHIARARCEKGRRIIKKWHGEQGGWRALLQGPYYSPLETRLERVMQLSSHARTLSSSAARPLLGWAGWLPCLPSLPSPLLPLLNIILRSCCSLLR